MGFPSNNFWKQEPGTNQQIKDFVKNNSNAQFQLFSKIDVNGENTDPVYQFLRTQSAELKGTIFGSCKQVPWSWSKFLVDKDGKVVEFGYPVKQPEEFREKIEKMLA